MSLPDQLPGIIWSGFLGLVMGNFATNPIYRLPRKLPLFKEDPYCDHCHATLTARDLFPFFSWLFARGKCRHCGKPIPATYAVVELLTCVLFIACYLAWGFSEPFILISLGVTSFIMLAAMLSLDAFLSDRVLLACMILGMLERTLQEGTIYGFAGSGFAALLIGSAAWSLTQAKPLGRDPSAFPNYLQLLVVAGIWLALLPLVGLLLALLISLPFRTKRPLLPEWVIIIYTVSLIFMHT